MESLKQPTVNLQEKLITQVAFSSEFLRQLFNIELHYSLGETFSIVEEGTIRTRKLHHLMTSDFITSIVLHVSCNTMGEIRETNPHNLYNERLCKLFQAPITYQEFKHSLKKLELNNLIQVSKDPYTKRYHYKLNFFVNENTGKAERYVVAHPVIFTEAFTNLPVTHIKMYFALIWQQGNKSEFLFTRVMDSKDQLENKSDIIFMDLKTLLHKQQNSDIRRVLDDLITIPLCNDQPLFHSLPGEQLVIKRGKRFFKIQVRLNPYYHKSVEKGGMYRYPLTPQESYKREASTIQKELEEHKIDELRVLYKGKLFKDLLYILKDRSKSTIKHAIQAIKEHVNFYNKFPAEIQQFVIKAIRHKSIINYTKIAREEGVYDYITFKCKKPLDKENRIYEFVSRMSYYSLRVFRKMCRVALPILKKYHSKTEYSESDYANYYNIKLDSIMHIDIVRGVAIRKKVHPSEYGEIENLAADMMLKNTDIKGIAEFMLNKLNTLEPVKSAPKLPYAFNLEQFMIDEYTHFINSN
ncbi:hypothetical protein [Bacillus sp. AFS040349]|uniref:hypothetical protein n=1 Tax=Bacillus sp. AFS040349 TaxID=2033502 RepID=UPI000BFE3403|nr:hypothetical protein [Bacillus sp. AFS040349]PGT82210.1 hypothetical protein COD11_15555 [Bacillus sp. AFS040349]